MFGFGRVIWSILARGPFLSYLGLTAAYTLSGRLALLLAVPPGYATPIFPPAGIAVAAMLIAGRATLPSAFLGSFLLNAWTAYSLDGGSRGTCLAVATIIAAASTLQAAVGGTVLRRTIGYPTSLDNGRDLSRLLLLSPVFSLTSASLSLGGLSALGQVKWPDLATSWISWWTGDTLGVLLVLPLMLVIAGEPRGLWRSRALPVAVPMLLFFALFVAIFVRVSRWEQDEALLEFRLLSQQIVDKIHSGLAEQEIFLAQLERSFSRPAAVSRADFRHLAQNLLQRFSTIQAVKWAPRIDALQRAGFEATQRAELSGFEIREAGPAEQRSRAGERPFYYPVTYVEPLSGNEHIIGFDLASELGRRAAIEGAINTGLVRATPPIRLAQEQKKQAGILIIFAVQDGPNGPGVVSVALQMGTFVSELLAPVAALLHVRLVDAGSEKPLYDGFSTVTGRPSYGDTFDYGGRQYRVEMAPTAFYLERHRGWQSWAVLVAGVISTGLLGALLLLGTGYTHRIETVVDQRTRDLESVNRRLQLEVEERQQAESQLRQAQRMEAIGQLTGGVAHDFNNLLMVIGGNAGLLRDKAESETVARRASAIIRAAEQGERLTRRLLAFSRRQMLRPDTINLRHRTHEIVEMLSRSLREDIDIVIDVPESLWPVTVDPPEFELALLNIGVNARDAMPNGGRLGVTARNVSLHPGNSRNQGLVGDFVALTLSDTGAGMTAEVQSRAFEPFFTTKEVGLGTGLGLSQVYGFAKQSGGGAVIDSEPGKGTTIKLFMPRASEPPVASRAVAGAAVLLATPARVLLVEDNGEVAKVTTELLRDIGSDSVLVPDGKAALAAVECDAAIDLVISDIVMPGGMSGIDLARQLRERRPELPILLATGYSQYAPQIVDEGFVLVEKPYSRGALVAAIRAAVERATPSDPVAQPTESSSSSVPG
jgi:signal transduction histidine kinase/CheY-like chemotaxis protein/integral membrane sensor domain MASE1